VWILFKQSLSVTLGWTSNFIPWRSHRTDLKFDLVIRQIILVFCLHLSGLHENPTRRQLLPVMIVNDERNICFCFLLLIGRLFIFQILASVSFFLYAPASIFFFLYTLISIFFFLQAPATIFTFLYTLISIFFFLYAPATIFFFLYTLISIFFFLYETTSTFFFLIK